MDRISDLAFRVNKVIPKESSDIVVAFFPIDRFLTPGFKEWFIKSPALFFAPYAMLLDPKSPKEFKTLLESFVPAVKGGNGTDANSSGQVSESKQERLREYVKYAASGACFSEESRNQIKELWQVSDSELKVACQVSEILANASLNTVRVGVNGTMTVNVDNVPAKIDSIEITTTDKKPVISWTASTAQELIGVIHGSFLSNGQPAIVDATQLGITNVTAVAEGSSDKELHFKMSVTKPIKEHKLTFKVVKKTANGADVESATRDYEIPQTPQITSVECQTGEKKPLARAPNAPGEVSCDIKGSSLADGQVKIVNADALGSPSPAPDKNASNDSELQFKMTISKPLSDGISR
jgi:hypothetical protein